MKTSHLFISLIIISTLFSCSSSNDVAQNGIFQKRKHSKGYHLNLKNHLKRETKTIATLKEVEKFDSENIINQPANLEQVKSAIAAHKDSLASTNSLKQNETPLANKEPRNSMVLASKMEDELERWITARTERKAPNDGIEPADVIGNEKEQKTVFLYGLLSILSFFLLGWLLGAGVVLGLWFASMAILKGRRYKDQKGKGRTGYRLGILTMTLSLVLIATLITVLLALI